MKEFKILIPLCEPLPALNSSPDSCGKGPMYCTWKSLTRSLPSKEKVLNRHAQLLIQVMWFTNNIIAVAT
jgi:hypothetical protein